MALVPCSECEKPISTTADSCPNCGSKNPHPIGCGASLLIIVLAIIGFIYFFTSLSS